MVYCIIHATWLPIPAGPSLHRCIRNIITARRILLGPVYQAWSGVIERWAAHISAIHHVAVVPPSGKAECAVLFG